MLSGKKKVIASIEARMGSSRLPGKVLMDINGQTALDRLLMRLRRCRFLDDIVLATTTSPNDDVLASWAEDVDLACFRGSEEDVLARVVGAHQMMGSDIIVEVTGDCPLLDPNIIDLGIEFFESNDCDVVTNCRVLSFPQGIDVQVFRFSDLAEVAERIADPAVREHVSLHFYENPDLYRTIHMIAPQSMKGPNLRFQLDYEEDLKFIREIYSIMEEEHGPCFGVEPVLRLLEACPSLVEINAHCEETPVRK